MLFFWVFKIWYKLCVQWKHSISQKLQWFTTDHYSLYFLKVKHCKFCIFLPVQCVHINCASTVLPLCFHCIYFQCRWDFSNHFNDLGCTRKAESGTHSVRLQGCSTAFARSKCNKALVAAFFGGGLACTIDVTIYTLWM